MTGRRFLLSVEPRVLQDALVEVLGLLGHDDDVQITDPQHTPDGHFDAAIVSGPPAVDADVVIELRDTSSAATVHAGATQTDIDIREVGGILNLVEQHLGRSG